MTRDGTIVEGGGPPRSPAKDNRWKLVDATMRRHGHRSHSLIETLHAAQEAYGFLDLPLLQQLATDLRVPLSKVYGVATFYNYFTLKPQGRHTCVICTGTACYIKGGAALVDEACEVAGVEPGTTTPDGAVSLLAARCFGSCGLAPAAVFDGEVAVKLSPEQVRQRIRSWMDDDAR
jgi:bidirectional [NiFe] hydrogenase diaphorase subunit